VSNEKMPAPFADGVNTLVRAYDRYPEKNSVKQAQNCHGDNLREFHAEGLLGWVGKLDILSKENMPSR
jgi:hypothetical protein